MKKWDYTTMLSEITQAFLKSDCLFDFLGAVRELMGIPLGILDTNMRDPARTDPVEQDYYPGEMKPACELLADNIMRGYLAVPKEQEITEELKPVLKLTADFVAKMPEITNEITTDSNIYIGGLYELLFSTNLARMASLRAQIGLSRFIEHNKPLNCFLLNISAYERGKQLPTGLENRIRADFMKPSDALLRHEDTLVLFHTQTGTELSSEYEEGLEKLLRSCHAMACVSEPIINPTHDYRLRHHYNQNEHVLLYLKDSHYQGKRLVHYDEYRFVSMVYTALMATNPLIFGRYRYVSNKVTRICEYDAQKGTDYFQTLFVYLNSRFSLNETAYALNIHRNTVVYRIKRLNEKFGIDFDSSEECFQMNLACRIYQVASCLDPTDTVPWEI